MSFSRVGAVLLLAGSLVLPVAGHPPTGIVTDLAGNIYYLQETGTSYLPITRLDPQGKKSMLLEESDARKISAPHCLAIDNKGNLYTAADDTGTVWQVTPAGRLAQYYPPPKGRGISTLGAGGEPFTVDREGSIFFIHAQPQLSQIIKIARDGKLTTVAGGKPGYADGPAARAQFGNLHYGALTCGPDGALYLTEDRCRVRKVAPDGTVSTLAGGVEPGFADGRGAQARFDYPAGLAVDEQGNVYVADSLNLRVRKITAGGQVSTRAEMPSKPWGVALGRAGALFVLGAGGVYKVAPDGTVTEVASMMSQGENDLYGVWKAALSKAGVKGDLTPAENGLLSLDLTSSPISDLSPLKGMPLSALALTGCRNISDLSPLRGMPLTVLSLPDTQVSDLTPLRGMRLTRLYLSGLNVTNLAPLKDMPLSGLFINGTPVTDLSPLRTLPLRELYLGAKVTDLTPLKSLPLRVLHLERTKATDLSPLKGLPLTSLFLHEATGLVDLTPLMECRTLRVLTIPSPPPNIEFLRQHPSLQRLGYAEPVSTTAEFWKAYDERQK